MGQDGSVYEGSYYFRSYIFLELEGRVEIMQLVLPAHE